MKNKEIRAMSPGWYRLTGEPFHSRQSQPARQDYPNRTHEESEPLSTAKDLASKWSKVVLDVLAQMFLPDQRTLDLHEWMSV